MSDRPPQTTYLRLTWDGMVWLDDPCPLTVDLVEALREDIAVLDMWLAKHGTPRTRPGGAGSASTSTPPTPRSPPSGLPSRPCP